MRMDFRNVLFQRSDSDSAWARGEFIVRWRAKRPLFATDTFYATTCRWKQWPFKYAEVGKIWSEPVQLVQVYLTIPEAEVDDLSMESLRHAYLIWLPRSKLPLFHTPLNPISWCTFRIFSSFFLNFILVVVCLGLFFCLYPVLRFLKKAKPLSPLIFHCLLSYCWLC